MKLITNVGILLALTAPFASASPYIGLEIGAGQTKVSGIDDLPKLKDDLEFVAQFKFYGGKYINDNVRTYVFYQDVGGVDAKGDDFEARNKGKQFGVGADYLHYFSGNFYGLAGLTAGYHRSELSFKFLDQEEGFAETPKDSGMMYEATLGLGYRFGNHFNIEGGYRQGFYKQHFTFNTPGEDPITLKSPSLLYVGFGYKF